MRGKGFTTPDNVQKESYFHSILRGLYLYISMEKGGINQQPDFSGKVEKNRQPAKKRRLL
jgi:hypothetical protein